MGIVQVMGSERVILMDYKRRGPHILIQAKAEAVMLAAAGAAIAVIADVTDRSVATVKEWLREWSRTRMASLVTGHADNLNASKLTAKQREQVLQVLAQPPSAVGIPAQFWSVAELASWLQTTFDVVYESPESYHFLFKAAGLSFHNPEPFDRRRAPEEQVEARMDDIRKQIAPALADPDTIVVAADEVRIDQEAVIRRAWYAQGTKTKLKVNRQRAAQSYIGFLDQKTGTCELFRMPWQNGPEVATALRAFHARHEGKNIVIVWDNAAWHRAKEVRSLLGPGNELHNTHLVWMPPYSPDHNPIEHVWKDTKESIANRQAPTFDDTLNAFETHIATRKFNYHI
jgi:transposase